MRFFMTWPVAERNGLLLWKFYEQGKRWPFYKGSVWAADFDAAMVAFRKFAESARQHRMEWRDEP